VEEDRAVRSGDFVVIDFSSTMDGQPLKGGKVQDRLIEIKPGSFLPGFTEQLIGLRAGITREITLTLPPDHEPKEIAGKTIVFEITIKEIKEKIVPPLDDNFARDVGEFETLTDLKNHLKQELTRRKEENIRNSLYNQITQKLIENNPFEVPPSLVERQTEYLILSARSRMAQLGIPIDSSTMSNRELRDFYRPIAEFQVKRSFLLAEIAKKEGIEVSPSDIKNYLQSHPLNSEDELTGQEEGERSAQIKAKLLEDKTLAFLTEKAKIKLIEPNKP
jgi:trigger factor